jgi:phosphate transport system protein
MRQPSLRPLIDIPHIASLAENMVRSSLDALVKRDEDLARSVLLSDNEVDRLRDSAYKELVGFMQEQSTTIPGAVDLMFIAHDLERIADHATNIAEDIIFWVRGLDVRHGRGLSLTTEGGDQSPSAGEEVMENSQALHAGVTPGCDNQQV